MTKWKIEYWVIPPDADGEFVAHMEEVLDTYETNLSTRDYQVAVARARPHATPIRRISRLRLLARPASGQPASIPALRSEQALKRLLRVRCMSRSQFSPIG